MLRHPSDRPTRRPAIRFGWLLVASVTMVASVTVEAWAEDFFRDVTTTSGLAFQHTYGDDAMSSILEATGSGCGFLDIDGDGNLDLYLVNGCYLEGVNDPRSSWRGRKATNRLFRGRGDGTLEDVTEASGVGDSGYGMALVAGDYDNDGDTDLYVTNYGPNVLYRNNGDGTLTDVSKAAGVGCPLWSVGAVFFDHDNDGDLDLFVGNYLKFTARTEAEGEGRQFPGPLSYEGQKDILYRNNGDGTFTDIAEAAGVAAAGRAMGVIAADFDDDRDVDLYVANDAMANWLYLNDGKGAFEEIGLISGTAFSADGDSSASMGGEFADYDGDGSLDLFVPDIKNNNLYRNLGDSFFEDVTASSGIARASRQYTSWGGCFLDFDNDGDRDIFVSNGSEFGVGTQENLLLENVAGGPAGRTFQRATEKGGAALAARNLARGTAMGDYDNDGDLDVLILCLDQPSRLLRNELGNRGNWLRVRLEGTRSNRDGIGARVRVRAGDLELVDERKSAASYLSQNDPRLHFGLGKRTRIDEVSVRWPSGQIQVFTDVPVNQTLHAKESKEEK